MELIQYALLALGSMFAVVNPIAAVPAFLSMTATDATEAKLRMAKIACGVSSGILIGFAVLGSVLFKILGISLPSFQIAGALVLLMVALDMLKAQRSPVQETSEETREGIHKMDIAITPLAVPMLAGPGAISTVIVLEGHAQSLAQRGALFACIVLVGIMGYVTLALAVRQTRWLSPIVMKIIVRLMGLLLAAIAVQFIVNAIRDIYHIG